MQGKTTPGRLEIGVTALGASTMSAITLSFLPPASASDVVAFLSGCVLSGLLVTHLVRRTHRRITAGVNKKRQDLGLIGSWYELDGPGQFWIRWSREEEMFYVQGWMGEAMHFGREERWENSKVLAQLVQELEVSQFEPCADLGTRWMRVRLAAHRPTRWRVTEAPDVSEWPPDIGDVRPLSGPGPY